VPIGIHLEAPTRIARAPPQVILLTAPMLEICDTLGVRRLPFLLALATTANIGSAVSLIGNPQNVLIGAYSGLGFETFTASMAPAVAMGLVLNTLALAAVFRADIFPSSAAVVAASAAAAREKANDEASLDLFSSAHSSSLHSSILSDPGESLVTPGGLMSAAAPTASGAASGAAFGAVALASEPGAAGATKPPAAAAAGATEGFAAAGVDEGAARSADVSSDKGGARVKVRRTSWADLEGAKKADSTVDDKRDVGDLDGGVGDNEGGAVDHGVGGNEGGAGSEGNLRVSSGSSQYASFTYVKTNASTTGNYAYEKRAWLSGGGAYSTGGLSHGTRRRRLLHQGGHSLCLSQNSERTILGTAAGRGDGVGAKVVAGPFKGRVLSGSGERWLTALILVLLVGGFVLSLSVAWTVLAAVSLLTISSACLRKVTPICMCLPVQIE